MSKESLPAVETRLDRRCAEEPLNGDKALSLFIDESSKLSVRCKALEFGYYNRVRVQETEHLGVVAIDLFNADSVAEGRTPSLEESILNAEFQRCPKEHNRYIRFLISLGGTTNAVVSSRFWYENQRQIIVPKQVPTGQSDDIEFLMIDYPLTFDDNQLLQSHVGIAMGRGVETDETLKIQDAEEVFRRLTAQAVHAIG